VGVEDTERRSETPAETDSDADSGSGFGPSRETALYCLRVAVFSLAALVGLSLLVIGTVAIIAEVKGTWHWMIHLESTVRYMALFISWVLAALAPLTLVLLYGRWRWEP
jgi:hypothetical protein